MSILIVFTEMKDGFSMRNGSTLNKYKALLDCEMMVDRGMKFIIFLSLSFYFVDLSPFLSEPL